MRQLSLAFVALCSPLLSACPGAADVQCVEDGNCNRFPGGVCQAAPSGKHWCSYPDEECLSGYRYSDLDVGDGVESKCVLGFELSISIGGSVPGIVTSEATEIECDDGTCSHLYPPGTRVQLVASSPAGSFLGWSDACSGFASCELVMDQEYLVGARFGARGQALWVQRAGSSGDDMGRSIASTSDGHLLVIGEFRNTVKLGAATFTSLGGTDVLVVKLDASTGEIIWARQFGSTGYDSGSSIAADDGGNVYIAGSFDGAITFGGPTVQTAGGYDAFVASLDAAGNHRWSRRFGGTMGDSGRRVAVRGTSVTVVGGFSGSMLLNGTSTTSAGGTDAFIVSFTTDSAITWTRAVGGTRDDVPHDVAIDGDGNIVVVGSFSDTTNLGGIPLASASEFADLFVAKYRGPDGAHLFSKRFGSDGHEQAPAVTVDASNNIYVLGHTVDVSGTNIDLFLAKYSPAGAPEWARSFGPNLSAGSLITNRAGNLTLSGTFCGTISFGGNPLSTAGTCASDKDIFAVRLRGTDGSHISSVRAGGTDIDSSWGVAQLEDGRVFVAGGFSGSTELGGETLMSEGGTDLVILALAPL
jgi:Beta-propeller repeat